MLKIYTLDHKSAFLVNNAPIWRNYFDFINWMSVQL